MKGETIQAIAGGIGCLVLLWVFLILIIAVVPGPM